jgi:hypothetical protein
MKRIYIQPGKSVKGVLGVFCFILLFCGRTSFAAVAVNYTHTTGSLSFDDNTTDATLDLFSGLYLGATYDAYHFDGSSGTIQTYGLRLGRYTEGGTWKLFGSATPEVSGYKATSAGGDFRTRLFGGRRNENPPPETEHPGSGAPMSTQQQPTSLSFSPRLDLIGGYTRTMFVDLGQHVDENDLTGGLGFSFLQTALTGTFTKSVYDQEFSNDFNLNTRRFNFGYAPTVLPGYPDYTYNASIDQTIIPGWWYVLGSYQHIKYKAGPDDTANAFTVGTGVTLFHILSGNLSYTRYAPSSRAVENYLSIGAGVRI